MNRPECFCLEIDSIGASGKSVSFGSQELRKVLNLDGYPEMLRVDEAAEVLRISRNSAYDQVAEYERTGGVSGLPAIRVGRCLRVPKQSLRRWIESQLGDGMRG